MKLLLVVAFIAAASAAEIRVQSLVLPEAPKPEVYEAPETQNEEIYDAVKFVEEAAPADDDVLYAVNVVDVPEFPNVEAPMYVQMIDIGPLIVPDEVIKQLLENPEMFADFVGPVDAVHVVDAPVDTPVDAVRVVDAPIEQERGVWNFLYVPDIGSADNVDPVQIVDGPVDNAPEAAFEDVQVDPVIIVDNVLYDMPLEYRRDLPVYNDPMLR